MTDDADGDRGDPSDASSEEEDPFIYPLADDDAEGAESTEEGADVADVDASAGTDAAGSGTGADAGTTAGTGETTDSTDAAETGEAGGTTSADTGAAGGTGRSTGRSASASSRTTGSGSSAGSTPSTSRSRATGGSTSTGTPRRRTDPGPQATDGRSHASAGKPHQPGRRPPETGRSRRETAGGPAGAPTGTGREGVSGWFHWFWTTEDGSAVYVRDVATSVAAVLLVGLVLFAISGIWPPMVAVESGSMEPNLEVGDLVFVVDNERFAPDDAVEHDARTTGIVPADVARETDRSSFGGPGDVVVYRPDGNNGTTPVIHRAMLWVEADEDWYDRADPDAVGDASNCRELNHCPAPHAGFITKGDANRRYDQQTTLSAPVRPAWIVGTAEVRIPYLGHIRLAFAGQVTPPLQQDPWVAAAASQTDPPGASHPTSATTSPSEPPTPQDPPAPPGPPVGPDTGSSGGAVV